MTAFPLSSDFADNIPTEKSKQRALIDATVERAGTLPASYSGFENSLVQVKADGSGLYPVQGTSSLDLFGAIIANFSVLYSSMEIRASSPVSNAVALDYEDGTVHVVTLNANVSSNGFTFSSLPGSKLSGGLIIIVQDGTGGRTIGGGSTVNAGFSSSNFDFGGITVNLPSAANKEVWCSWAYRGTGKVQIREYLTGS